jgi:hypothetical protein
MKRRTIVLVLIMSLLSLAAVGFNGCGKKNSITSITITPADPFIAKSTAQQLFVTALFSDGMRVLFWTQVTWQSSDPTVATVSSNGLVFAVKEGTAIITATDKAHPSIAASVTVKVTELTFITIDPLLVSIPVGSVQQFTATGVYTSATTTWPPNLTPLVTWSTSSTAIAVISNVTPSHGIATAVSAGTTTITATYTATGATGTAITGTATLIVDP